MKRAALFVYVWPEPYSSAAGVRTEQLIRHLQATEYSVTLISPCKLNDAHEFWKSRNIHTIFCPANNRAQFSSIQDLQPDLVIFDRFVMEEQFGWQVSELWPKAIQFVDTQDLHHIRRAREELSKNGATIPVIKELSDWQPDSDFDREFSSLARADGCFVVSSWERDWMISRGYPAHRIFTYPFSPGSPPLKNLDWNSRKDFLFLGNFRHPPNLDAIRWLTTLWPEIHKATEAKLVLAGAYPPQWISELDKNPSVKVIGNCSKIEPLLAASRLLLAPLRFGAGIKGKILEAWNQKTPVIGTSIAFEGMGKIPSWDSANEFIEASIQCYLNESRWTNESELTSRYLQPFQPSHVEESLKRAIESAEIQYESWRSSSLTRALRYHQSNSYKYFSLWIEEKNRGK